MILPRVDLYILPASSEQQARLEIVCRLAHKAYRAACPAYIYTEDEAQTRQLDDLLWEFPPASFIPHAPCLTAQETSESRAPVHIGHVAPGVTMGQLLFNLSRETPAFCAHFERIIEVVLKVSPWYEIARQHYRHYRQLGYDFQHHQVNRR